MERNNNKSGSSLFGRMSARASFISKKELKVTVQLLNDADTINTEFKKSATGKDVLDYVCQCLNISESDYFGLRYQDHHRHRYWVDLTQTLSSIAKLFKSDNIAFRLRFRYYPSSVSQLREEITRYQLNVQLQRDLLHGRLYCPQPVAAQLAAFTLQSQIGDAPSEGEGPRYVSEYKLLLKQTPKMEEKIALLHRELRGTSAAVAERRMIEMASQLETYGFDPYTVKEAKNSASNSVYIGATHRGILVFHGSQKAHHMQWSEVTKLDYTGSELRIHPCEGYEPMVELEDGQAGNGNLNSTLNQTHTSDSMVAGAQSEMGDKKNENVLETSRAGGKKSLRYQCPSRTFAKHLWVHLLSQKAFFNENSSEAIKPLFSKPRIPILTRGSTFRFPSQRVLKEIETSPVEERLVNFVRYELPKQTPRSDVPTMTKYHVQARSPILQHNGTLQRNGKVLEEKKQESEGEGEKRLEKLIVLDAATPSSSSTEEAAAAAAAAAPVTTSSSTTETITVTTAPPATTVAAPPASQNSNGAALNVDLGQPLAHSTPKNGLAAQLKRKENGANGTTSSEGELKKELSNGKKVELAPEPKVTSGVSSFLVNSVFLAALLLLLFVLFVIVLFERQELAEVVEAHPWLIDAKSKFYDGWREAVVRKYTAMLSR